MSKPLFKYLNPEDIRKLASFEFAPKTLVEGYFAGRHRSSHIGLSTEFRDYRAYAPGDELRALDWKVFARTDRNYVRTYNQETNTLCHILLDCSASMGFGGKLTKLEYASFFTAALCHLVTKGGNQVSLELFDDHIRAFHPPGSTGRHMRNLMRALEENRPGNPTSIATALRKSFPLMKRRGTLIVISDFYDHPGEVFAALNPYVSKGFGVYLFHVLDPGEIDLTPVDLTQFVDMENQRKITVHADSIKAQYRQAIGAHLDNLRALAVKRGIEYVFARTDTHYFTLFDALIK